jgi:hypothetical protein
VRFDTTWSVAKRVPFRATKIKIFSTKAFYLIPGPAQAPIFLRRSVSLVRLGAQSLHSGLGETEKRKEKALGPGPFPGTGFLLDVV